MAWPSWLQSEETPIDPVTAANAERRKGGYIDPTLPADPATGLPPPPAAAGATTAPATEAPQFPGIAPSTSGGEDQASGTAAGMDVRDDIYPHGIMPVGPMGPARVVQGPAGDYSSLGGAEGLPDFTDTFVTKPAEIDAAGHGVAEAEGKYGESKADFYRRTQDNQANELAILQQRRLQHQEEIAQKQQRLEEATTRYSNDLADRGQFWKEPAHIIGAIGAAMMALGSGGPTIGLKLINDAVNADFQQRKQLADMHLGELRSNLGSYRQIAGDSELGDRLALAESYRVAQMEGDRIAAQFHGPVAKARWALTSKQLAQQTNILKMNTYNAAVFHNASIVDPRIAAANTAAGKAMAPGAGFTTFASGSTPQPGVAPATGGSGAPSGSSSGGQSGTAAGPGGAALDHVLGRLVEPMSEKRAAEYEARAPGSSQQVQRLRMANARRAWFESGGKPSEFHTKLAAIQKDQESDIKEIGKAAQPFIGKVGGLRRLGTDIKLIEIMADRMHTDPDTLMGEGSRNLIGSSLMAKYRDTIHSLSDTDPKNANKYKRELQATDDAVESFKQALAGSHNAYIHEGAGSAVNASENARMAEYLRKGWRGTTTYHSLESRKANDELNNAINSTGSPASGLMYRAQMGIGSSELDRPGIPGPSNAQKAIRTLKGR